ncbi:HupE/UreJ family protein [Aquabacterium sp.]|uniref:HupE/UreJ family protein n=1 Tax=Aquabacterium sp. TaxID=1872578 RepID=UPI002488FDD9|nr:HupE/UreJ family protein [Aquabacterium sp.]MDI1259548.1 HupE/UreJ family protein [Aquabacterium sp.]
MRFAGWISRSLMVVCAAWLCTVAHAHKPSDSYLTLTLQNAGQVNVNWHIALRDLDTELRLDRNDDGQLTWGEVRPRWAEIMNFARPTLSLRHAGQDCTVVPAMGAEAEPQIDTHTDGRYAVLRWTAQCALSTAQAWQSLSLDYRLFALTDPSHRGIVRWRTATSEGGTVVLGTPRPAHELGWRGMPGPTTSTATPMSTPTSATAPLPASPAPESFAASLWRFVQDGVHHIAIGTDHILFLMSLLLVAVWQRPGRPIWSPAMAGWRARPKWPGALGEVLRLVTAFTIAHSITLGLAAFGVLSPPSRWVESLIALSVLLAALDNLWPLLRGVPRWSVVFGFGLVHGFGFAGALQDLGLAHGELAAPLLGFNLGVELGQLALVSVSLPFMLLLRRTAVYRWLIVGGGSLLIAALALVWLIERVFDVVILGWGG